MELQVNRISKRAGLRGPALFCYGVPVFDFFGWPMLLSLISGSEHGTVGKAVV